MKTYINYLHSLTTNTRPTALAIVPKATQAASPEPQAIMVARYLGERRVDKRDGTFTMREMWTHKCFTFVCYISTGYARIRDMHGILTLPVTQVSGLPVMVAEKKIA